MAARDSSSQIRNIILEVAKEKSLTERQVIDLNRRGWTMTEIKAGSFVDGYFVPKEFIYY